MSRDKLNSENPTGADMFSQYIRLGLFIFFRDLGKVKDKKQILKNSNFPFLAYGRKIKFLFQRHRPIYKF